MFYLDGSMSGHTIPRWNVTLVYFTLRFSLAKEPNEMLNVNDNKQIRSLGSEFFVRCVTHPRID